jgi:CCR4-NOT transcriptional regulation complex NOT5 subunit
MDEKMKSAENEKLEIRKFSQETVSDIQKLVEIQKDDQKHILQLRDTIAGLKNQIEVLTKKEKGRMIMMMFS